MATVNNGVSQSRAGPKPKSNPHSQATETMTYSATVMARYAASRLDAYLTRRSPSPANLTVEILSQSNVPPASVSAANDTVA